MSQRDKLSPKARRTIFTELLDSDLPESEKSIDHLSDEAQVILGAGSMTTAHVMAVMTFHLLKNPDKLDRLCTELQGVMPDTPHTAPSLQKLEALPYFVSFPHASASSLIDFGLPIDSMHSREYTPFLWCSASINTSFS